MFYQALTVKRGIGAQVKKTVMSRKNFLPQTSDRAPISGALRKDNKPCQQQQEHKTEKIIISFEKEFLLLLYFKL